MNLLMRVMALQTAMLWIFTNDLKAQGCHMPDPDTVDYKQIPWYGDESNYTVLDRMYYEMNAELGIKLLIN